METLKSEIQFIEFGVLNENEMDSIRGGKYCNEYISCKDNRISTCTGGYGGIFVPDCNSYYKW